MYKLLDGKLVANNVLNECKNTISELKENGIELTLCVLKIGEDEASTIYFNKKKKVSEEVGINFKSITFGEDCNTEDVLSIIKSLNYDKNVDGIFIEMPIPKKFDSNLLCNSICENKDVDGLNNINIGRLEKGEEGLFPCTALGIIEILNQYDIKLSGKHCVILNRTGVVGRPVSNMLLNLDATLTICHSKTENLKSLCKEADILIVAINKPKFIDKSYIKKDAIVIDVGIHYIEDDNDKKICGDVNFDDVKDFCEYITPVPGGVGAVTTSMLVKNCIKALKLNGKI